LATNLSEFSRQTVSSGDPWRQWPSCRSVPSRAEIALIVARLPCSEAGVERAFSRLELVFGDHRRSIQDDLIEPLLLVRLHGISNVPGSSQVLDSLGRDLSTRGDGDQPHDESGAGPPPTQFGGTDTLASQPEPKPARWGEGALELRIAGQLPPGTRP
jgi:hypothetical protein